MKQQHLSNETTRMRLQTGVFVTNSKREMFPSKLARAFTELVALKEKNDDPESVNEKLGEIERLLHEAHTSTQKAEVVRKARIADSEKYHEIEQSARASNTAQNHCIHSLQQQLDDAKAERAQLEEQDKLLQQVVQHKQQGAAQEEVDKANEELNELMQQRHDVELTYETRRKQVAALAAYVDMLQEDVQSPSVSSSKQLLAKQAQMEQTANTQEQQHDREEGEHDDAAAPEPATEPMAQG